eukprot:768634-Hanusia_phi.AAC.4
MAADIKSLYRAYNICNGLHIFFATIKLLSFSRINFTISIVFDMIMQSLFSLVQVLLHHYHHHLLLLLLLLLLPLLTDVSSRHGEVDNRSPSSADFFSASFINMYEMMRSGWSIFEMFQVSPYGTLILCLPLLVVLLLLASNLLVWLLLLAHEHVMASRRDMKGTHLAEFVDLSLSEQVSLQGGEEKKG